MTFWKTFDGIVCGLAAGFLILGWKSGALLLYAPSLVILTLRAVYRQHQGLTAPNRMDALLILVALYLPFDLSTDAWRYLWEGYVQTQGYSPYMHAPETLSETIIHVADGKVDHAHLTAIYPPLAQYFFQLGALIRPDGYGWKIVIGLCWLAFMFSPRGRQSGLYLAAPLLLFEGFWNAHLDVIGIIPAFFLVDALRENKAAKAGLILGLMIAFKLMPAVFGLACLLHFPKKDWLRFLIPTGLAALIPFLPYIMQGEALFASFLTFSKHWSFNNPFFIILHQFMHGDSARLILSGLLGVTILVVSFTKWETTRKCVVIWLALCTLSPTFYPWYLLWLIPFVPERRLIPLNLAYASACLSYLVLIPFRAAGVWAENWLWLAPEWLLLLACFTFIVRDDHGTHSPGPKEQPA